MTREEKELLLADLCARLPYDVMVDYESHIYMLNEIDPACKDIGYITVRVQEVERLTCAESAMIEDIKPYLRPMSSMTEEEINEFHKLRFIHVDYGLEPLQCVLSVNEIDWLLAHHFDYRGLIEKGLAIEAPEGMYK